MQATSSHHRSDDGFDAYAEAVRQRAAQFAGRPIFRTAPPPGDLFATYLAAFPDPIRQVFNCHGCHHFLRRFGGLVVVNPDGTTEPVMWGASGLPEPYATVDTALAEAVRRASILDVFLSSESAWGAEDAWDTKRQVTWRHFIVPALRSYTSHLHAAEQAMAEKREEYGMLQRGLAEFPRAIVQQAVTVLEAEALYRSEKCLGVAKWLLDLHDRRDATKDTRRRDNLTWQAVATAPPGFCHVRSTMIGTLLADLAAGMPFDTVKTRFAEKMNPLQYQRPTAAPSMGNIAQAEKVVAALKSAGALERRFAKLADIETVWTPRAAKPAAPQGGVFAHLHAGPKSTAQINAAVTMTWEKFARTVLPGAEKIECLVPVGPSPFVALVTAANPDAPPILQWDSPERRNRVNWYLYATGSLASRWNLQGGAFAPVVAISHLPPMWHTPEKFAHHGAGAILILQGCRDTRPDGGLALFPETLKSEYHPIRATIEAHSARGTITGAEAAEACGIDLRKGRLWNITLAVTSGGVRMFYKLDRWD